MAVFLPLLRFASSWLSPKPVYQAALEREWLAWGGKSMKIRLFLTLGKWKHVQSELGPRLD